MSQTPTKDAATPSSFAFAADNVEQGEGLASSDEWSDRLSAYLDGESSPEERARIEFELNRSPELRAELASLEAMMQGLAGLREVAPPTGFAERVTKVAATSRRLQESMIQSLASMPLQLAGVGILLVVAVAYFLLHGEILELPLGK